MTEYGLYFDDVLMDTFILSDDDFNLMLSSVGLLEFEEQNETLKEDWLYLIGGTNNPKITIVNLTTLEKLE